SRDWSSDVCSSDLPVVWPRTIRYPLQEHLRPLRHRPAVRAFHWSTTQKQVLYLSALHLISLAPIIPMFISVRTPSLDLLPESVHRSIRHFPMLRRPIILLRSPGMR